MGWVVAIRDWAVEILELGRIRLPAVARVAAVQQAATEEHQMAAAPSVGHFGQVQRDSRKGPRLRFLAEARTQ